MRSRTVILLLIERIETTEKYGALYDLIFASEVKQIQFCFLELLSLY